ncbi:MAG: 1-acyl-sn-glycerol-3-phosphate acyltransferase [Litoreibacter sp.]|nr:1-acyl-sn-glycerol-3-phosphate acyltransferase [Litoreibacter sp.]
MTTWHSELPPPEHEFGAAGWIRVVLRGVPLALTVFGGLGILMLIRLIERPLCGVGRPVTPYIVQFVSRAAFVILGISHRIEGRPMTQRGSVVSNHVSWLDIFALNARKRVYFVSKSEVADWPVIGVAAQAVGTVFIRRNRQDAGAQKQVFEERLKVGHKLLFFPEGTSSDGQRVLPFKSTLFAAFFDPELRYGMHIQPVTLNYRAPQGADPRFYAWWGDMEFGAHFLSVLAAPLGGAVTVHYHVPLKVSDFHDRKALAARCEADVRSGASVTPEEQATP